MAKAHRIFVCRECGGVQNRWVGKCPDCGAWSSLDERLEDRAAGRDPQRGAASSWRAASSEDGLPDVARAENSASPITEIDGSGKAQARLGTGFAELDRVLGGGLVPGSAVLVGGDPGIGKSTLMLQAAGRMAAKSASVLYVSSEESAEQVRLRAERLGVAGEKRLFVLAETNLARIAEQIRRVRPAAVVIDSVQMVYTSELGASPGSVPQLRRCCAELVYLAKLSGTAVIMVGHVTKTGELAGPRLLEHLVDTVLYFEGDRYHIHRVVRGIKNRFGATLEIGVFEMTGSGPRELPDGLGIAAADPSAPRQPGVAVCPVLTGSRCVMVEIQALTATGFLGAAKRKSSGLDASRLAMVIAVLEQHGGLRLADRDIFASSVGGIRVVEPGADLAVLLAIAGANGRKTVAAGTCVVGEVGLSGEVRAVPQAQQRIREAARLGYRRFIGPRVPKAERETPAGIVFDEVGTVEKALEHLR